MTAEFVAIDLSGDSPPGVCPECVAGGILHRPTGAHILYCVHARLGAYRAASRDWRIVSDIDVNSFKRMIVRGLTVGELLAQTEADVATYH